MSYVLILFFSRTGHIAKLAEAIGEGAESTGMEARLRTVPSLHPSFHDADQSDPFMDAQGYLYASKEDLADCAALALGSPSRFGAIAAPLKGFLEQTSDLWLSGTLVDRPAGVFTSASTLHGGHEGGLAKHDDAPHPSWHGGVRSALYRTWFAATQWWWHTLWSESRRSGITRTT